LDEDEFARKLIPELFKHNNYASFVRQLNMYGFHKKVGLSDNSMRASERKNKSPSEYANPYFKRGHPDLLWLIQKPKNVPGQGSKGSGKGPKTKTEDGDDNDGEDYIDDGIRDERPRPRGQLTLTSSDDVMPKEQLAGVYQELQTIRQQQQIISSTISKLRREHEQLYAQAANFQEQHTRHENSINAILTFLATVYNRSLNGHDGQANLTNTFSGIISQDQGNVMDVGDDFVLNALGNDLGNQNRFKKQPLLLKAPPTQPDSSYGRASTLSPSTSSTYDRSGQSRKASHIRQPSVTQTGSVEEVHDTPPQQTMPGQPDSTQPVPQRDIMSVIQNTNARNGVPTTFTDFPNLLSSLENHGGNSALTPNQRADMLRLMANETTAADPGAVSSSNNALITPTPPPMPHNYSARLASTRNEIDNLMKMQAEQDRSVQNLTNMLQPLSPTGTIPGLANGNVPPPSLDLDQIFNSQDYFTDLPDLDSKSGFDFGDTTTSAPDQTSGTATAAVKDASNDLFDFDNLAAAADGSDADLFNGAVPNRYYDGFDDYAKPLTGYSGSNVVDSSNDNNKPDNPDNPEHGRIVETLTDSEATSPANTVDENNTISSHQSNKTSDGAGTQQSPKRRRKA
jgi:heat shock transcription factor